MILISGATGFLGAHLTCQLLSKGASIKAMRRASSSMYEFTYIYSLWFPHHTPPGSITWVEADILDIASLEVAFENVHTVYHCAAMVSFHQKDKTHMHEVNVDGTANMVNVALTRKHKPVFCHVSSIAALGRAMSDKPIDEHTKWIPSPRNTNYAVSKYKAEMEVWRGQEEGLSVVVVNPGVIIGAGDWNRGTCKLFDTIARELPFFTDGVNGYVDVRDVARAMILLTEAGTYGERFVLVGANVSNRYLMQTGASLLHKKPARIRVGMVLAECAWIGASIWSLFTRKRPFITRETARASIRKHSYHSEKVKKRLSFDFTPFDETLAYICTHYIQSHI